MVELVVLTPTFNRRNTLERLYDSLKVQSYKNFTWLIIDDGSEDDTFDFIEEIQGEKEINIEYYRKENGGKGSALNCGFSIKKDNSFLLIVDSDDYLIPNGLEIVKKNIDLYDKDNIGAIFFRYQFEDGAELIPPKKKLEKTIISNRYSYNKKYGQHDGCIGYFSRATNEYIYPIFKNEIYIGPTVIQMEMINEFDIVFSTDIVGVAEYQNDGISKSGRVLRLNNPKGMIYYGLLQMNERNSFLSRIKYAISIWPYAILSAVSFKEIFKSSKYKILLIMSYLPGRLLYYMWKKIWIDKI